jgi:hypothetical protein
MLVVKTIAEIRRAHVVQGKAICRELKVARKLVREVVRSEATASMYERADWSFAGNSWTGLW